jgi:hypothetical protein
MTRKLATQTCGLSETEEEWQARDALLTSAVIILGNPRQSPSLHLTDVTCYFFRLRRTLAVPVRGPNIVNSTAGDIGPQDSSEWEHTRSWTGSTPSTTLSISRALSLSLFLVSRLLLELATTFLEGPQQAAQTRQGKAVIPRLL